MSCFGTHFNWDAEYLHFFFLTLEKEIYIIAFSKINTLLYPKYYITEVVN